MSDSGPGRRGRDLSRGNKGYCSAPVELLKESPVFRGEEAAGQTLCTSLYVITRDVLQRSDRNADSRTCTHISLTATHSQDRFDWVPSVSSEPLALKSDSVNVGVEPC